jgi:hypothetical protein
MQRSSFFIGLMVGLELAGMILLFLIFSMGSQIY